MSTLAIQQAERRLQRAQESHRRQQREQWWKDFWAARPEHTGLEHGIVETRRGLGDGMWLVCVCGEKWFVTGQEMAAHGFDEF